MPNSCVLLRSCSSPAFCTKLWLLPSHSTLLNYSIFLLFHLHISVLEPLPYLIFSRLYLPTVHLLSSTLPKIPSPQSFSVIPVHDDMAVLQCLWVVSLLVPMVTCWLDCCSFVKGAVPETLGLTSVTWRGCVQAYPMHSSCFLCRLQAGLGAECQPWPVQAGVVRMSRMATEHGMASCDLKEFKQDLQDLVYIQVTHPNLRFAEVHHNVQSKKILESRQRQNIDRKKSLSSCYLPSFLPPFLLSFPSILPLPTFFHTVSCSPGCPCLYSIGQYLNHCFYDFHLLDASIISRCTLPPCVAKPI